MSFSIKKGEFAAVTGSSGIGKSTLLKLLLAIYSPQGGTLSFSEKVGKRLKINASMRPMFAYVPQGSFLLSGTIKDTLASGGAFDMEKLSRCCKIACADEFIEALPLRYENEIGEKGAGLSEGQIQRLAVARALYSDSPILLLDEATSALDEKTEKELLRRLREMSGKTVIIVTHRKAAAEICDKTINLEKAGGKNAEGTRISDSAFEMCN